MARTSTKKNTKASAKTPLKKGGLGLVTIHKGSPQTGLFNNPNRYGNNYRPRLYAISDVFNSIAADRSRLSQFGRELFATEPTLGGAIIQKNTFAFGENWTPTFHGANKTWGEQAEDWLINKWMPICNVLGSNYDFLTTLYLSGIALDVDGDSLLLPVVTRNGFPMIQLVPSHRIGNRLAETVVQGGRFDGYPIQDGVVTKDNRAIGYKLLADTKEDDIIIPVNNANFLFAPEFSQQHRGVSRIGRSVLNWLDIQDIDTYEKAAVKLAASVGLIHKTENGSPDASAIVGADDTGTLTPDATLSTEQVDAATVFYLKANTGEEVQPFMSERPSPNVESFINRLERQSIYSMGWFIELMNPEKLGGAGARFISNMANQSIRNRQAIVERRAKYMVNFALATAMQNGYLPKNYNDQWWNWTFTKPAAIVIDSIGEGKADIDNIKMGVSTLEDVISKTGKDWYAVRNQQQKETEDLLDRANVLSKKYSISLDKAIDLLQQRGPNPVAIPADAPSDNTAN